jgi:hypothetical protein
MSKLSELLSKATPEKATAREVDELSELTGKRLPQEIFDVMQTSEGLISACWIMQKRNNPEVSKEDISKQVTMDNDIEIGYEMLYCYTRLTREQVTEIRKSADTRDDPNRKIYSTEDYKEFQNVIDETNKFMKSNKNAKFSVVVACEFVPLEKVEKNAVKTETPS